MKLAIFDIDGTLCRGRGYGNACIKQTFKEEMGIGTINTNWHEYIHNTDSGIYIEIVEQFLARKPTSEEISRLQRRYYHILEETCAKLAQPYVPITGAAEIVAHLRSQPDWAVAIASGNWRHSGEFKLRHTGIDPEGLPAGYAEDGMHRHELIDTAHKRALETHRREQFDKVVYLGDAPWDVKAAKQLGVCFVGVCGNFPGTQRMDKDNALATLGATHLIENYSPLEQALDMLEHCTVPTDETSQEIALDRLPLFDA